MSYLSSLHIDIERTHPYPYDVPAIKYAPIYYSNTFSMLMAYLDTTIYEITNNEMKKMSLESTDHIR